MEIDLVLDCERAAALLAHGPLRLQATAIKDLKPRNTSIVLEARPAAETKRWSIEMRGGVWGSDEATTLADLLIGQRRSFLDLNNRVYEALDPIVADYRAKRAITTAPVADEDLRHTLLAPRT